MSIAACILIAAFTVLALAVSAPSVHAVSPAEIEAFIDGQAPSYLNRVEADGDIPDPVTSVAGGYGAPSVGSVGLRVAKRRNDDALFVASLRAMLMPVQRNSDSPFDHYAVATGYEYGQRVYAADPRWVEAAALIVPWLNRWAVPAQSPGIGHDCWYSHTCYNNWKTVELEALATMKSAGVALSPHQQMRYDLIQRLIVKSSKATARTNFITGRARILSDPPTNPIAYAAFSYAHISGAIEADPALAATIGVARADLGRYLRAVQAPDGEITYFGRSQGLSWTLASMMAGEAHGGRPAAINAAWTRLRAYGRRADGTFAIAPSVRHTNNYSGLDHYAYQGLYEPLTLLLLTQAAEAMQGHSASGALPSRNGALADPSGAGIRIERRGRVWFAQSVRSTFSEGRYRRGPLQLKVSQHGKWTDLLPARPPSAAQFDPIPTVNGLARWTARGAKVAVAPRGITVTVKGRVGARVRWAMWLPRTTKTTSGIAFDRTRISVVGTRLAATASGPTRASVTHLGLRKTVLSTTIGRSGRAVIRISLS